jgi:dihydrodipicolinate synthase/N-acetylneuraminate lyase
MIRTSNIDRIGGMEFAIFKLKEGVTEAELIELSRRVEAEFLCHQDELVLHFLVRGADGIYADVAVASSQEKAEEYCQQWLDNKVALEYLALIEKESVNMTFWTKIN